MTPLDSQRQLEQPFSKEFKIHLLFLQFQILMDITHSTMAKTLMLQIDSNLSITQNKVNKIKLIAVNQIIKSRELEQVK